MIFLNLSVLDNIYKKNCGGQLLIKETCKLVLLISVAKLLSERKNKFYIEDMLMFWTLDDIIRQRAIWHVCQSDYEGHKPGIKNTDSGSQCLRNALFCKL